MTELVFGNVKHPAFVDRPIQKREGAGQNDLGQRTVKGVTWHRMLGSLWGTDTYFHRSDVNSLTDYGVGVTAQDGASHAGEILRWNNPLGRQSGWASGTYSAAHAYGDGAAFVNKYGINAINRDRASIEISGFQNTPLDEKSKNAVAALTAYWADQCEIPWDVFPIAPQDGFSFICFHDEFGPDNGQKKCPFDEVKQETPDIIERARAIMKAAQVGANAEPEPYSIWWDAGSIGPQKRHDGTLALAMWAEVRVKTAKGAQLRQSVNGKVLKKVSAGTRLVLRGTHVSDKRSKWAFVALPGEPNKVYRVPLVHLDPKYPTL